MSIELNVYGRDRTLAKLSDLQEGLGRLGWRMMASRSWENLESLNESVIRSAVVFGWLEDSRNAGAINEALLSKDREALKTYFEGEELAAVEVTADESFSADPEMLAELEDADIEQEHLAILRDSPLCYTIETAATRNDLSLELQETLWTIMGVAIFGLMHDPESDEFTDCRETNDEDEDS